MATEIIKVTDLPESLQSADLIADMVAGANAKAARVAPCLVATGDDAPTDGQLAEARLVLLGAVKRWAEAGAGALQQQNAGPFGQTIDTRQRTGFNLWPSEIESLQDICHAEADDADAYMVDMTGLSSVDNPLAGAVVDGPAPMGQWSEDRWSW